MLEESKNLKKMSHRGTQECLKRYRSGRVASHVQRSLATVGAVVERGREGGGEGDEEDDGGEVGGRAERRHDDPLLLLLLVHNWSHAKVFQGCPLPIDCSRDRDGKTPSSYSPSGESFVLSPNV